MESFDNDVLTRNLFLKRDLLAKGDAAHAEIRTVLLLCGGGMRGAYGAGAVIALHQLGLAEVFDVVVGISTGAAIASYFLAGYEQTLLGTSIYYDECTKGFISYMRWPIVDIGHIERVMRGGRKKLDIDAVRKHRSRFIVGATEYKTGNPRFIEACSASPDPLTAIKASFAITEARLPPVMVNGIGFTDGATSMPFPARMLVEAFHPTDLLVIANSPAPDASGPVEGPFAFARKISVYGLPPALQRSLRAGPWMWQQNLDWIRRSKVRCSILWGPGNGGLLTRDRERLRRSVIEGASAMHGLLGREPSLPHLL